MRFRSTVPSIRRRWRVMITALCLTLVLHLSDTTAVAVPSPPEPSPSLPSSEPAAADHLPSLKPHALPLTLANWHVDPAVGDYFANVEPTNLGYLVWSSFPVKVYLDTAIAPSSRDPASEALAQAWQGAVERAIAEWNTYIPLEITESADAADITVLRRTPPLVIQPGQPLQARSAETRYEFYANTQAQRPILSHRFQIFLRSDQSAEYVQAAARHELGHALGIWGHSTDSTDALYRSQVRDPAPISPRDVNTLYKIYQQPTRLGWAFPMTTLD